MTRDEFLYFLDNKQMEIKDLFQNASREYSSAEDCFENFNKLSAELGVDRKDILWIYLAKHSDGVTKHLRGYKSQRDTIDGRIKDMIVYLLLLSGMLQEEASPPKAL